MRYEINVELLKNDESLKVAESNLGSEFFITCSWEKNLKGYQIVSGIEFQIAFIKWKYYYFWKISTYLLEFASDLIR
ncbi:FERM and PDZ domain-containing protein [Dirofilaria immitis]